MHWVTKRLLILSAIWAIPVIVALWPYTEDPAVRALIHDNHGTVANGVGVSMIFMLLPTAMVKALPFPWEVDCTFQNMEVFMVIILCIIRATTGIAFYVQAQPFSAHMFYASTVQILFFITAKTFQKIKIFTTAFYIVTNTFLLLILGMFWIVPMNIGRFLPMHSDLVANTFGILGLGELMYSGYVENTEKPNNYMCVAIILLGVACSIVTFIVPFVDNEIDSQSLKSGLIGFAFIAHYFGFRTQEKRLQSESESQFVQVPHNDFESDNNEETETETTDNV